MKGAGSLIRVAGYDVETLRKRLAAIVDRRCDLEMKIAMLDAEAEAETAHAGKDAEAGWYLIGYRDGWKIRRAQVVAALRACEQEEAGARDALAAAFETLKKYEHVADLAAKAETKAKARKETAAIDEMAQRRAVGQR